MANNLAPHSIEISRELVQCVKGAHAKYLMYLEEEKRQNALSETQKNAEELSTDIKRKTDARNDSIEQIVHLDTRHGELCIKAEQKNQMKYLIEANGLKRKAEEKRSEVKIIEDDLNELNAKKKKLM